MGISRWIPGFKADEMQDKEMLSHVTCADCRDYDHCTIIQAFIHHPGYKYAKYGQALKFIRMHDYAAFLKAAEA